MMTLSMMYLAVGLSSCGSVARKLVCDQVRSLEVKPLVMKDASFQFNRCRWRCFNFNTWDALPVKSCPEMPQDLPIFYLVNKKTGDKSEAVNMPLETCEGVAGFDVKDMANYIRPNIKGLAQVKKDYCN